jgi:hypothetical protein
VSSPSEGVGVPSPSTVSTASCGQPVDDPVRSLGTRGGGPLATRGQHPPTRGRRRRGEPVPTGGRTVDDTWTPATLGGSTSVWFVRLGTSPPRAHRISTPREPPLTCDGARWSTPSTPPTTVTGLYLYLTSPSVRRVGNHQGGTSREAACRARRVRRGGVVGDPDGRRPGHPAGALRGAARGGGRQAHLSGDRPRGGGRDRHPGPDRAAGPGPAARSAALAAGGPLPRRPGPAHRRTRPGRDHLRSGDLPRPGHAGRGLPDAGLPRRGRPAGDRQGRCVRPAGRRRWPVPRPPTRAGRC